MLRHFLLIAVILGAHTAAAQDKEKPKPVTTKVTLEPKIDYHQPGAPMPRLDLITFDTLKHSKKYYRHHKEAIDTTMRKLTDKDFDNKGNLIVMMFNPTCGHCEDQTDQFEKNISLFSNTRLVMLSNLTMKTYMPDFIKNHHVKDYPAISIGMDNADFIKETFLYSALPQINVYSKDRKLIKIYNGEVKIDSLKQYID